jgi:hypothetical protein
VGSIEPAGCEGGCDNLAGEHFSKGGDMVGGARGDFSDGGDAAQKFVESFEVAAKVGMEFGEACRAEEFAGSVVMALLQGAAEFEGGLAFSRSGGFGHGQQSVGHFGHGADDDYRFLREAAFDDRGDAVDGFGVFDGSSAELHDDHGRNLSTDRKVRAHFLRARSFAPPGKRLRSG